jgi:ATP-dependent exoDNAse (exonuclease V) alpha subunit
MIFSHLNYQKEEVITAIYHLSVKTISRKKGKSAVAAAAYRSGEKLHDEYFNVSYDFTHKNGILYKEIILPGNAPIEFSNRSILWNEVEKAEKRKDSRTAREVEIALPNELTLIENIELVKEFIEKRFVRYGMCADVAIHQTGKNMNNPHAHILLTTRPVECDGFSRKKNRDWDCRKNVEIWREDWGNIINKGYERKGLSIRVSHESYVKQGIDKIPTKHLGVHCIALEKRGLETDRCKENRQIIARNKEREEEKELRLQKINKIRENERILSR